MTRSFWDWHLHAMAGTERPGVLRNYHITFRERSSDFARTVRLERVMLYLMITMRKMVLAFWTMTKIAMEATTEAMGFGKG